MDMYCCYVCPPKPVCNLGDVKYTSIPSCFAFIDPPSNNVTFTSPMCNENLILNGVECGKKLFCKNNQEMKYYNVDC